MRSLIAIVAITLALGIGTASATIYNYNDLVTEWPGYKTALNGTDAFGNPDVLGMRVLSNANGYLSRITVFFDPDKGFGLSNDTDFNSLFINTQLTANEKYDDWDFYVTLTNDKGTLKASAYDLTSLGSWAYTFATDAGTRQGHPNGINTTDLTSANGVLKSFGTSYNNTANSISFDFYQKGIYLGDNFVVGYTEYCANDNFVSPNAAVPEPATMLLLGSGLLGVAAFRHRSRKA